MDHLSKMVDYRPMVDNIDQWSIISTLWPACINIVATCKGDQILNEMGSQITCIYTSSQIRTGPPPKKCQILLTGADRDFRGVFLWENNNNYFWRLELQGGGSPDTLFFQLFLFRGGGTFKKTPCTYIFKTAVQWCPSKMPLRDALQRCSSRMPLKDAPQGCPSKMLLKDAPQGCPSRMPLKDAPQRSPSKMLLKDAPQGCPLRMPLKDAPQRCPSKKPLKDVPQWCPSMMPFKDAHPFQHR